jgi:outer membrane biosynthesis protein TonB
MMKEHAEPHFDDERTILSARRVVPLEKIEKKARHRRQWFLGGAFAIAMMLGAASALLASYLKLRNAPQTATEVTVKEDVPAPVAVVESTPSPTPIAEEEQVAEITPPVTLRKEEPAPKHRTVAAHPNVEPVEDRDVRQPNEEERLQQIRDAVLYDQWQERRARRELRRERRRADRYNHRDLSNLDEIFEGRRRP